MKGGSKLKGNSKRGTLVVSATLEMTQEERAITTTMYTLRCIEEDIQSGVVNMGVVRSRINGKDVVLRARWERVEDKY